MCFRGFHHLVHTILLLSSFAFDFPLYFALNQARVVHLLHVPIIIVVSFDRVDSDVEGKRHQIAEFEDLAWSHKPMHDCDVLINISEMRCKFRGMVFITPRERG